MNPGWQCHMYEHMSLMSLREFPSCLDRHLCSVLHSRRWMVCYFGINWIWYKYTCWGLSRAVLGVLLNNLLMTTCPCCLRTPLIFENFMIIITIPASQFIGKLPFKCTLSELSPSPPLSLLCPPFRNISPSVPISVSLALDSALDAVIDGWFSKGW